MTDHYRLARELRLIFKHEAADEIERLRAAAQQARAALSAMLTHMGMDEDAWNRTTFAQARNAVRALDEALK